MQGGGGQAAGRWQHCDNTAPGRPSAADRGHGNKDGNYDRDLQPALRQTRLPPLPRIRHFLCGPRLIRTTPTLLVTMGYGLLTYQVQGLDAEPSIIIIQN